MYLKFRMFFWAPSLEENNDEFPQGKFVAWSFNFPSKRQLRIFFNFNFSFVYFIGAFQSALERRFAEIASILPR